MRSSLAKKPLRRSVVALAAGALLLSACSSAVGEQNDGKDGKAQDGGILKIGSTNDLIPATVFTNSSDTTNTLIGAVYDSLVDYPLDSLEPQPSLATSWTLAKDGLSLELQLRDDVKFHTGRPFTSKDVEFSIKTWADPVWTVQLQRTAAAITTFDTSDPHAITLGFDHPLSNVFDLLDMLPIIDSETFADLKTGKNYVGTGPFTFESWQPNAKVTFARNDDYWGDKPKLDGVEVDVISDPQAQVAQLRSGQVDLVTGASNRDLESLGKDNRFDVTRFDGAEKQVYVGANVKNPLLTDVRLRKAVAFALDRDRIVDEVYRGAATAASLPWPEYSPAYDAELNKTYFRDEAKAKALVKQVGDVGTIPLAYPSGNANYEAVAQIVQSNLADIGIKSELKPTEFSQFIKQLIGAEFEGLWILEHSYAQYTPSTITVSAYPFNADKNASHFEDAAYKKHANAAWERPDGTDAEAVELYRDVSEDLIDNAFLLEIAILYPQVATSGVQDVEFSKRSELRLNHAYLTD